MSGFFKRLFGAKPPPSAVTGMAAITSREAAEAAWRAGKLARIHLFPIELGGEDRPENVVYVPRWVTEQKDLTTRTVATLVRQGMAEKLEVKPVYKGASFVPSKLLITASKGGETRFSGDIEIW